MTLRIDYDDSAHVVAETPPRARISAASGTSLLQQYFPALAGAFMAAVTAACTPASIPKTDIPTPRISALASSDSVSSASPERLEALDKIRDAAQHYSVLVDLGNAEILREEELLVEQCKRGGRTDCKVLESELEADREVFETYREAAAMYGKTQQTTSADQDLVKLQDKITAALDHQKTKQVYGLKTLVGLQKSSSLMMASMRGEARILSDKECQKTPRDQGCDFLEEMTASEKTTFEAMQKAIKAYQQALKTRKPLTAAEKENLQTEISGGSKRMAEIVNTYFPTNTDK